jgi:type I restriction enzyme, S subunit
MTSIAYLPLAALCETSRDMLAPDDAEALRRRYLGLEDIESGTGLVERVSADSAQGGDIASATFAFDQRHVLYGKLRPYLNKVALPAFVGRCSTEIIPLLPTQLVSREYLSLLLRSNKVINAAMRSAVGSRMPRANLDELMRVVLPVVPSSRQDALVQTICAQTETVTQAQRFSADQVADAVSLSKAFLRQAFNESTPISAGPRQLKPSRWSGEPLLNLARLESGHTPSRRRPDWWGGHVPWLALPDIRKLHGKVALETTQTINDAGLANSSARLLPVGTVCLCRDASIGFVTMLGRPMATSQHFCNWVCDTERLDPEFLMYAFMASFDYLRELGSGSVLKTIYMPTIESFHVCAPPIDEQRRIARTLRAQLAAAEALQTRLAERQAEIERLPQRILAAAFGEAD